MLELRATYPRTQPLNAVRIKSAHHATDVGRRCSKVAERRGRGVFDLPIKYSVVGNEARRLGDDVFG